MANFHFAYYDIYTVSKIDKYFCWKGLSMTTAKFDHFVLCAHNHGFLLINDRNRWEHCRICRQIDILWIKYIIVVACFVQKLSAYIRVNRTKWSDKCVMLEAISML